MAPVPSAPVSVSPSSVPVEPAEHDRAVAELQAAIEQAEVGLVDRRALLDLVALAAVAREHVLVIGPPGTAKSEAVRRIARATGGRYFEYLLGRFTEPSELFGPVDLRRLRDGVVETQTKGMMPEAEIAFLDEVFLGSTAILNTLLGLLNERVYRRGHTVLACPLRVCVGASNQVPEDDALAAFADRFLVRMYLEPVADPSLEELLEAGWLRGVHATPAGNIAALDVLARVAERADPAPIRPLLAEGVRMLRAQGIHLTDRRVVKVQRLVVAAGAIAGRTTPGPSDLWPIVFALPNRAQQEQGREALRELLASSENAALLAATEEASLGPLARARRLSVQATALLEQAPAAADRGAWRLKLEGVAREIDAGFASDRLPADLSALRARLVDVLGTR